MEFFMCDIMVDKSEDKDKADIIELEQILIKAESLKDAYDKLVKDNNFIATTIIEENDQMMFVDAEVDNKYKYRHILIGRPSKIIE